MVANVLCRTFCRMTLSRQHTITRRLISSTTGWQCRNNFPTSQVELDKICATINPQVSIRFKPSSLNIEFGIPIHKNIIQIPLTRIPALEEPSKRKITLDDPSISDTAMDLPPVPNTFEKHAIREITIRRKKMRKHKRKKLRRKMKQIWQAIRVDRNVRKEKAFRLELHDKIKVAEAFDAKQYVSGKLAFLRKERVPYTWRGEILGEEQIKQFIEEKRQRKMNRRRLATRRLTLD